MQDQYNPPVNNPSTSISADDLALLEACRNDPSILFDLPDHCWIDMNGKLRRRDWITVSDAKERMDDRYPADV